MSLFRKYLTSSLNPAKDLSSKSSERIYTLLVQVLAIPHTVDDAIQIFSWLKTRDGDISCRHHRRCKILDISHGLALACQDTDTRLVEIMLKSEHNWKKELSYYYPYLNLASLDILVRNPDIDHDEEVIKKALTLNRPDLFEALLIHDLSFIHSSGDFWDTFKTGKFNKILLKYPYIRKNKAILETIKRTFGDKVLL